MFHIPLLINLFTSLLELKKTHLKKSQSRTTHDVSKDKPLVYP